MSHIPVAIVGATGMVGQKLVSLLEKHPWFRVVAVSASLRSAGKTYADAVCGRWRQSEWVPNEVCGLTVAAVGDIEAIRRSGARAVFCAVDMPKADIQNLEEAYAHAGFGVISNNSANRFTDDVPVIIPEINPTHLQLIESQRQRLTTKTGFIVCKPNCSLQGYVVPLGLLRHLRVNRIHVATYQALSGAGKTLSTFPEMVDNLIPYIPGEEEKSEHEPMKILAEYADGRLDPAKHPCAISAICIRVPISNGHTCAVWAEFEGPVNISEVRTIWEASCPLPQALGLPSAPIPVIQYQEEPDRPQPRLDRDNGQGMAITVGRLRQVDSRTISFVALSHNTIRGAAGGAILTAELLAHEGYLS